VTITPEGGRVLGCLVEKQLTTPQQYPLTLNALALACSQSTNREPVMTVDDQATRRALQELKELHLVRFVLPSHGRSVTRYRHVLDEAFGLDTARVALLAVLLLRGPQTLGELRSRTMRMSEFDSLEGVQAELEVLVGQPEPLVRLLPRQPGQKEERWQQLVAAELSERTGAGGSASVAQVEPVDNRPPVLPSDAAEPEAPRVSVASPDDPEVLEQRVDALASEVAAVRDELSKVAASLRALRQSLGE
jgi:hypothetical protein